jgi:hypothetical protein
MIKIQEAKENLHKTIILLEDINSTIFNSLGAEIIRKLKLIENCEDKNSYDLQDWEEDLEKINNIKQTKLGDKNK